jgi:heterodisulfide reductase subunit A
MVSRRAAYITYPQAVPQKAVIDREGSSPCSYACPAGIKAHGYTALVRGGKYDEAFNLVLDKAPLVGSLGRACYAPCEGECTRGSIEGTVPIRRIKRFIADKYYQGHAKPEYGIPEEQNNRKIAIVGSGPAGITAAFFLAQKGYKVTIFEAASKPGGMLRLAIPSYRLPKDVLDRDIENITALGVEIKTGVKIENIAALKEQGFEAVFLATGTHGTAKMQIEGEDLEGITSCLDFLRDVNLNKEVALKDKTVLVVGGGNVAMDSARAAIRLGAKKVIVQYRRRKDEMPAHDWEIEAAQTEGIEFQYLSAPIQYLGQNGKLSKVKSIKMELGEADASGRRKPVPVKGSEYAIECDLVITAIGLKCADRSILFIAANK